MARDGQSFEQVDKRQSLHEQDCAHRYNLLEARLEAGTERMKRIEVILYLVLAMVLLGVGNHPGGAVGLVRELIEKRFLGG